VYQHDVISSTDTYVVDAYKHDECWKRMLLSPMLLSGIEDKFYSTAAAKGAKLPLRCSGADLRTYRGPACDGAPVNLVCLWPRRY
jgi:hypothetical protein